MENYNEFADYYDFLMKDVDYENWYGFLTRILEKNQIKYKSVLEMGCGTGNITEQICEDMNVTGVTCFDISEDMLTVAKEKLKGKTNIEVIKQDMRNISLSKKYDLILSCCDSINYITRDEDLKTTFEKSYELLNDGGALIFDINSYYKLSEIIGNNTFVEDEEDVFYVWENEYEEDRDLCNFFLTFFIKEKSGNLYSRFDEHHIERAYKENQVLNMLKETGFENVSVYYDFDISGEYNSEAERLFFCCKKL